MSWLTYCCCIAVIACGIGLFHMARASSRPTSVQINTTKQFWFWGSSVFTALPGAHICLKKRICVHIPVGYSGSLSTVNETCNKTKDTVQTKLSVHIFQVHPHIKFGCTLVRLTCHHCSIVRSLMSEPTSRVSPYLFAAHLTSSEVVSDFQIWCSPGCQMHLDQVTMKTCSQSLSASRRIMSLNIFSKGAPRTCHEFSTSVRWLSYVDIATRVSPYSSLLTITFDWCWIWYWTFNILRWCRRCRCRQAWHWRRCR